MKNPSPGERGSGNEDLDVAPSSLFSAGQVSTTGYYFVYKIQNTVFNDKSQEPQ
jgi:hypothetical protein